MRPVQPVYTQQSRRSAALLSTDGPPGGRGLAERCQGRGLRPSAPLPLNPNLMLDLQSPTSLPPPVPEERLKLKHLLIYKPI